MFKVNDLKFFERTSFLVTFEGRRIKSNQHKNVCFYSF